MKIGYDAKRAFLNNTGLGNYSRWLVKAIAQHYPANSYLLYTPKTKANRHLKFFESFENVKAVLPKSKLFTSWWRSKGIINDLKRDGVELYHGLSHELPSGIKKSGIRSVVTMHDLIFMLFPGQFGFINYHIYLTKVKYACNIADKIIAISQKTKADIIELLNVSAEKIEVIYQGCDPAFAIEQTETQKLAIKTKYNLPDKYILNVGTIEERKNLMLIARALPAINDYIPLIVVGRSTKYAEEVEVFLMNNKLTNRVIFLNDVTFAELPAIYQQASVFVYPSRYEGFGIPVLEALNSGVPVIAATGSCLEEAGGPDSLYIEPDDAAGLAKKVNMVLADDTLKQNMIQSGHKHAALFTDDKLTAQIMELYINTLNHA